MAPVKTYHVLAKRWAHGWELHIDGVGVTQSRSLADARDMAREYIALELDTSEDAVAVEIVPEIGGGLDEEAAQARNAIREAEEKSRAAAAQFRMAVRKLKAAGLTGADMAQYLGLSPQRVSQLLREEVSKAGTKDKSITTSTRTAKSARTTRVTAAGKSS